MMNYIDENYEAAHQGETVLLVGTPPWPNDTNLISQTHRMPIEQVQEFCAEHYSTTYDIIAAYDDTQTTEDGNALFIGSTEL